MKPKIFITGSTGYVGGRLKQQLEEQNYFLKCLVRSKSCIPYNHVESTQYVVTESEDRKFLAKALDGIEIAYYLIQSGGKQEEALEADSKFAEEFAKAAFSAKIKKIIYLSALGNNYEADLSPHFKNRQEIGHILRAHSSEVQVIELRSSMIIGSGSFSYEMIKALVDTFPFMLAPKWMLKEAQPIAIQDLLHCLIKAIDCPLEGNPIFEVGGRERLNYKELMIEYAKQIKVKRYFIPLPFFASFGSSFWLAMTTPLYLQSSKRLVELAISSTVVHDPLAAHIFEMKALSGKEAIAQAINNENTKVPKTRWNDPLSSGIGLRDWSKVNFGRRLICIDQAIVPYSIEQAFAPIRKIGGKTGYYFANWIWKLRGVLDLLIGGVGLKRGRRDPENINLGDVIDFWRVTAFEPNKHLKLLAEMKTPGRSVLEFTVSCHKEGVEVIQKATFDPIGISGILYWYFLYLPHRYVFRRMFKKLIKNMGNSK